MANIWMDMMCAYYPRQRLLPFERNGRLGSERVDLDELRKGILRARIDVAPIARYTSVSVQNILDKLLAGGYISPEAYVKRLPAGLVSNREDLISEITQKSKEEI